MKRLPFPPLRQLGLLVASTLALGGCGGGEEPALEGRGTIEVFSWWVSGSETQALDAMLDVYRAKHPGVSIINAAATGAVNATEQLERRMVQGLPPDLFQVIGGVRMLDWVKFNGKDDAESKLEPIDALAKSSGWLSVVPKPIADTVTYNGHVYAVPVDVHRGNCLFYNKKIFDDNKLTPPTTLQELMTVSAALKAKGITPLAIGAKQPWTVGFMMWENILVASAGADYYRDFYLGKRSPDDAQIKEALETAAQLFRDDINADADQLLWQDAVALVADGKAAMNFMGDWAKGELRARKKVAGVDFGEVNLGDKIFVYVTDAFVLPKGAPDRSNALDLLATMGSVAGEDAFNPIKGSIPARADAERSQYDVLSQQAMDDIKKDTLVPARSIFVPTDFMDRTDAALGTFLKDQNVENMILALRNYYDVLQTANASP